MWIFLALKRVLLGGYCSSLCVFLTPGTSVKVHPVKRLASKPSKFVVL